MAQKVAQDAFNHLVGDLRATHGDNLASVVLYGSAALGDRIVLRPDYNLLVALNRITPEDLRQAQAPVREWQRLGHPPPVYFTFDELSEAADVFPIEFHQMERARVVLYGRDPFESLKISDVNLRHQTEYELRSKLIQLRRHYIPASASADRLVALMRDSLPTFAALFAPALMLHGQQQPPVLPRDLIEAAARAFKLDADPFDRILNLRDGGLDEAAANQLFADYMTQIEAVIAAVDRIELTAAGV